jgi:hypothetical protein
MRFTAPNMSRLVLRAFFLVAVFEAYEVTGPISRVWA